MSASYKTLILLGLFLISGECFAQRVILDSVIKQYRLHQKKVNGQADSTEVNYLVTIAKYAMASNRDLALQYTNRADSLSKLLDFKAGQAQVMVMRARLNSMGTGNHDYEKAIDYTQRAEELASTIGRMDIVFDAINNQAVAAYRLQDYEQAYNSFQKGIERAQAAENATYLSHYQMNLGVVFTLLENHTIAHKYLKKSLETHRGNPGYDGVYSYERMEAIIVSNLGYTSWKLGELSEAKKLVNESLAYFRATKDESWISFAHMTLAGCLAEQDSLEEALSYYNKNIEIKEFLMGDPQRLGQTYLGLGRTYKTLGQIDSAFASTRKAHTLFKNAELKEDLLESAALLSSLYNRQNQIDSALYYQELSERINEDSRLELINANLNLKESEKEQNLLIEERKIRERRDQLRLIALFILASVVIIALWVMRTKTIAAERTKNKLEELNILKDQVFKFISQDLTIPVDTLEKVSELSENPNKTSGIKQFLPELKVNIDHSSFVLTNFHFWTQAHKKTQLKNEEPIDINRSFTRAYDRLKFFSERNLQSVQTDIEQCEDLYWDPLHFAQVLENLLCNAVRFTPTNGQIHVKGQRIRNHYELTITNDNNNFTAEKFKQAIDLLSLYREPSTEGGLSAGIGLSVSHYLSTLNSSELYFQSSKAGQVEIVLRCPLRTGHGVSE